MQIFKSNNIYLIHGHGNIVKMNRGNSSKSTEPVHKQPTKILPNPDRNIRETTMIWSEHSRKKNPDVLIRSLGKQRWSDWKLRRF